MPKIKKNPTIIIKDLPYYRIGLPGLTSEIIDIETGIRYLSAKDGLTPRLNSDGTVMLASQAEIEELLKTRG